VSNSPRRRGRLTNIIFRTWFLLAKRYYIYKFIQWWANYNIIIIYRFVYSTLEYFIQQSQIIGIVTCYLPTLCCCFQSSKKSRRQQGRFIVFQNDRKTMTLNITYGIKVIHFIFIKPKFNKKKNNTYHFQ